MPTFKDMDCCLPELKRQMNLSKDPIQRRAIQIAINIIVALPVVKVEDGVLCKQCGWFDADGKRCMHNKGLRGRLKPEMYCAYGSEGEQNWFAQENEFADLFGEDEGGEK